MLFLTSSTASFKFRSGLIRNFFSAKGCFTLLRNRGLVQRLNSTPWTRLTHEIHRSALCSSPFTLGYISESGGIDNCFANCYSLRLENHNVIGHRFANGELVINSSKTGMKRLGKKNRAIYNATDTLSWLALVRNAARPLFQFTQWQLTRSEFVF
jgi:hypothetical protein